MINFDSTPEDAAKIAAIVDRAMGLEPGLDRLSAEMDLTACHLNGAPLDLDKMLACSPSTLMHDIGGISRHMDVATGQLGGQFFPRCAAPEVA